MHQLQAIKTLRYVDVAIIVCLALFVFAGIIWLRNLDSLLFFFDISQSVGHSILYALKLLSGVTSQFSFIGSLIVCLFSVLVSVNVVLVIRYIAQYRKVTASHQQPALVTAHGIGGVVAAVLGIGCAACGTAVLFSMLSIIGASGLLVWLPLHGEELALLGLLIMGYTTWYLLGALQRPLVC